MDNYFKVAMVLAAIGTLMWLVFCVTGPLYIGMLLVFAPAFGMLFLAAAKGEDE